MLIRDLNPIMYAMANLATHRGLDGSIAYEADRAENAGDFVSDTLGFVSSTVSPKQLSSC